MLSTVLGNWVDKYLKQGHSARDALKYVGGVQFVVLCVIMLVSTFVPRGAFAFNPKVIDGALPSPNDPEHQSHDEDHESDLNKPGASATSDDGLNEKGARESYTGNAQSLVR